MFLLWQAVTEQEAVLLLTYVLFWSTLLWCHSIARGLRWWEAAKVPTMVFFFGGLQVGLLSLILWQSSALLLSITSNIDA